MYVFGVTFVCLERTVTHIHAITIFFNFCVELSHYLEGIQIMFKVNPCLEHPLMDQNATAADSLKFKRFLNPQI